MEISLPLDRDGFLRRECPRCTREFKWHNGPASEETEHQPPSEAFYCPLCGEPAGPESWWTQAQLRHIENTTERFVGQELDEMFKGLERSTRGNRSIEFKAQVGDVPDPSEPLVEPDDMIIVASPCHKWEPVKIPVDHVGIVHCLICGEAFAI